MGILKIVMIVVAAVPIAVIGVIAAFLFIFTVLLTAGWIQEIAERIKTDDFGGGNEQGRISGPDR